MCVLWVSAKPIFGQMHVCWIYIYRCTIFHCENASKQVRNFVEMNYHSLQPNWTILNWTTCKTGENISFFPSLSPSTSSRYRWIQCSRWWITFHFPMKLQSNPTIVDFGKMKMLLLNATACVHTKNFVQHTLANWFQLQMIGENPSHRCNSLIYILKMNFCQWSFIRMKCIGIWNTH